MTPATSPEQGQATLDLIRLFVAVVGASALVTILARRIALPYTVALVAFGMVVGSLARPTDFEITPQLVLVVLLPGLIFEAAYQTDFDKLWPSLPGVALLAGPGVLISAAVVALLLHLGAGLAPVEAFVVGAMLSATDPAAVIATFRRLHSPRRLATIVEAESLFNDGTGIVVFAIAVSFVHRPVGPAEIGVAFVAIVAWSTLIGLATGFVASWIIPSVGDHLIEVALSVVLAYGSYLAADAAGQSGVIAAAVAGLTLGNYGRRRGLSARTQEALDTVWEFVAFLLTALVFLLVGFTIGRVNLDRAALPIAWAIVGVLVGRALIVYVMTGGLQAIRLSLRRRATARIARTVPRAPAGDVAMATHAAEPLAAAAGPIAQAGGPGGSTRAALARETSVIAAVAEAAIPPESIFPRGWLHVIFWSGLRGAVSTALALSLPSDFPDRSLLQGITFGVVLFTLLVQGTTAEFVVRRWTRRPESVEAASATGASGTVANGTAGGGT